MTVRFSVGFCSDLHLGSRTAARLRLFDSVEKHDAYIVSTLMMQCTKRSLLWILGDVASTEESLHLLHAIPGRKRLIIGNHDDLGFKTYLKYFDEVHGFMRYKQCWLSHCPIHPQEMIRVSLNIHGHIHRGGLTPPLPLPYLNVNWDFWSRAVSLEEVIEIRDRYNAFSEGVYL